VLLSISGIVSKIKHCSCYQFITRSIKIYQLSFPISLKHGYINESKPS